MFTTEVKNIKNKKENQIFEYKLNFNLPFKKSWTNIINIINDLKDKLNINILFVTHDIESIKDICDDIVIIKNGYVVEFGKTQEVLNNPQNEYTKKLLNSSFKNKKFRN